MAIVIKELCGRCQGTGEYTIFEDASETVKATCPECGGSGKLNISGFSLTPLEQKLDEINQKLNQLLGE